MAWETSGGHSELIDAVSIRHSQPRRTCARISPSIDSLLVPSQQRRCFLSGGYRYLRLRGLPLTSRSHASYRKRPAKKAENEPHVKCNLGAEDADGSADNHGSPVPDGPRPRCRGRGFTLVQGQVGQHSNSENSQEQPIHVDPSCLLGQIRCATLALLK